MITENNPNLKSWVDSANTGSTDFPIQNLPFGIFSTGSEDDKRIGIAIGDMVLDVKGAGESGLFETLSQSAKNAISSSSLNDLMKLGRNVWREVRAAASVLLKDSNSTLKDDTALRDKLLIPMSSVTMHLPANIGDYTDYYASVHHATNIGTMFRPDNPLLPNYKHMPVGYHGRASSIVLSETPIKRPMGQTKADDADLPTFGPCRLLDYELEMGFFVGPGNPIGSRIEMTSACEQIFGMVIVNDWSARDIQKWEYVPLGPFNAKNFATSISPWVVTLDALEPYRLSGPPRENLVNEDPPTLEYLKPTEDMSLDITCEVWLHSEKMRNENMDEFLMSRGNFREMYWTIAQMLVHHTSTGCPMNPGDMLASGTLSGPTEDSRGSMLEKSWRGQNPIPLPDGTERKLLQDGDEVIIRAYCEKEGAARVGFGECRGIIQPAG